MPAHTLPHTPTRSAPRSIVAALLVDLGCAGVELAPHPTDPARLRYRPAVLPPDLAHWLHILKAELLAVLRGEGIPDDPEARYVPASVYGVNVYRNTPGATVARDSVDVDGVDTPDDEARHVLNERLGVADGLGLPTHTGSPAWLTAVGEAMEAGR